MIEVLQHKRGDTFDMSGSAEVEVDGNPVTDFTGWTFNSQIKDYAGATVADLTCEWLDASLGLMRVHAPDGTDQWPIGEHEIDIQFTVPGGAVVSTETAKIIVVRDITQ